MRLVSQKMNKKIVISGKAGQGVKLISVILGKVLTDLGFNVSLALVYGPSVRSGLVESELIYSENKIDVTMIEKADIMVRLSKEETKYKADKIICDKGGCEGHEIPFSKLAVEKLENKMMVNMIALGSLLKAVNLDFSKIDFKDKIPAKFLEKGVEAIKLGYDLFS